MRDILDKLSLLMESTGLANRKPGDRFKNENGDILVFQSLDFYPEQGGKLEEPELNKLIQDLGSDVRWQITKKPKSGGVAIATFDSEAGPVKYGFVLKQIYPSKTENKIKNEFDGYKYDSKAAVKEQSGLSPTDLLSNLDNLSAKDIISQLDSNPTLAPELKELARIVASGGPYPIRVKKPEGISFTGIRDYFCEILQPMALQTGQFKGNAGEAAVRFMGGSFDDTVITFPTAKNNGLADSYLTKSDGKYVKISSKGGSGGAPASIKNLLDAFKELESSPSGQKLAAQYADTISLITELQKAGQNYAPLYLGQKYGIIDRDEAEIVNKLRRQQPVNLKEIDNMDFLTPNLKELAKTRKAKNMESVDLYYHLLSCIAYKAADKVNDSDFGEAASTILNNGALIQVYSDKSLKEQGDELVLSEFVTTYPGESVQGVFFDAAKTYYSTGINGNFTFYIDRGQGKPKDKPVEPAAPTVDLDQISQDIVEPRLKRTKTVAKDTDVGVGPAGRAKREKA